MRFGKHLIKILRTVHPSASSGTSTALAAEHDDSSDEQLQIQEEAIDYNALLVDAAREQSYIKFGTKIGPKISNEFDSIIFPKMEEAIAMTVANLDDQTAASLTISERPSGNYGEKISMSSTMKQAQI